MVNDLPFKNINRTVLSRYEGNNTIPTSGFYSKENNNKLIRSKRGGNEPSVQQPTSLSSKNVFLLNHTYSHSKQWLETKVRVSAFWTRLLWPLLAFPGMRPHSLCQNVIHTPAERLTLVYVHRMYELHLAEGHLHLLHRKCLRSIPSTLSP